MRIKAATVTATALLCLSATCAAAAVVGGKNESDRTVSEELFRELEEAARLADIAYCVGISGIWKPFGCLSRCSDFPSFELVDVSSPSPPQPPQSFQHTKNTKANTQPQPQTWNTGPLYSDSCGYIALDHAKKRVIVAFRGTYSLASALADLATTPQVYVPYPEPGPPTDDKKGSKPRPGWKWGWIPWFGGGAARQGILSADTTDGQGGERADPKPVCTNCTVHLGFLTTWLHTRPLLLPHLTHLSAILPHYETHLIGHSLGGALAALAGLELRARGGRVVVTTFGEPRVGNVGLVGYFDSVFGLGEPGEGDGEEGGGGKKEREGGRFRRVTHAGDPVPLLPLTEWGYAMHGGEIYISSPSLPVLPSDVEMCVGDADGRCIAGSDSSILDAETVSAVVRRGLEESGRGAGGDEEGDALEEVKWGLPTRFRVWQLLFAHRDYFWRVGLCVPGGDPGGWGWFGAGRRGYGVDDEDGGERGGVGDEL
ncbi:hypothetical protein VE03_09917 [Pseudogymnoascus sp. 23342-1-I1]|nr:hypothetical protein VE03_09917 [Pseudogymnoascus sp. 23342-1-I1]